MAEGEEKFKEQEDERSLQHYAIYINIHTHAVYHSNIAVKYPWVLYCALIGAGRDGTVAAASGKESCVLRAYQLPVI